jgi:hypothetical protein
VLVNGEWVCLDEGDGRTRGAPSGRILSGAWSCASMVTATTLDWTVGVEHLRSDGTSTHPRQTQPVRMTFTNLAGSWHGQPSYSYACSMD